MKKKIIAIALTSTMAISCFGLSGCLVSKTDSSVTSESSFTSEYASKYDFYADSVKKLKDNMELTDEEADKVFGVLVDNCVDDKITYCFDETDDDDNKYYKVWWGLNYCYVYLKDNAVDKIKYSGTVIYENGEKIKPTEVQPTEEQTTEKDTTEPQTEKATQSSVTKTNEKSDNNFQTYDNEEQQNTTEYVLNTSTKKVHKPNCSAVKKISPENYATISSLEDAYAQGYKACKICKP